jgi:hypothetical protein
MVSFRDLIGEMMIATISTREKRLEKGVIGGWMFAQHQTHAYKQREIARGRR